MSGVVESPTSETTKEVDGAEMVAEMAVDLSVGVALGAAMEMR